MITKEQFEKEVDAFAERMKKLAADKGLEYDLGGGQFETVEQGAKVLHTPVDEHLLHLATKHYIAICNYVGHRKHPVESPRVIDIAKKIDDLQVYLLALRMYMLKPAEEIPDPKPGMHSD